MSECRCPLCADPPAKTYTEEHRHACEVRYVANMDTNVQRAAYMRGVTKARGAAAADRLRRDAWALMSARA